MGFKGSRAINYPSTGSCSIIRVMPILLIPELWCSSHVRLRVLPRPKSLSCGSKYSELKNQTLCLVRFGALYRQRNSPLLPTTKRTD